MAGDAIPPVVMRSGSFLGAGKASSGLTLSSLADGVKNNAKGLPSCQKYTYIKFVFFCFIRKNIVYTLRYLKDIYSEFLLIPKYNFK